MSLGKLAAGFFAGAGVTIALLRYQSDSSLVKDYFLGGKTLTTSPNHNQTKITDLRLRDYISRKGNREIRAFEDIMKDTELKFPKEAHMVTDLAELYFFRWLLPTLRVKKALEIGVFTGSSSVAIAKGLPRDGKLVAVDISEEFTGMAREYWKREGLNDRVDLRIGKGLDVLRELIANKSELESYDFVFIDANKPDYKDYYEYSLKLLKKNGVMCFDNTLWGHNVANPAATDATTENFRLFNEMLRKDDKRVDVALTTIGDGVTFVRKL